MHQKNRFPIDREPMDRLCDPEMGKNRIVSPSRGGSPQKRRVRPKRLELL